MEKESLLSKFKNISLTENEMKTISGGIFCSEVPGVISHLRNTGRGAQADVVQNMWDSGNLQCEQDLIA